jgi:hypothetical protein
VAPPVAHTDALIGSPHRMYAAPSGGSF